MVVNGPYRLPQNQKTKEPSKRWVSPDYKETKEKLSASAMSSHHRSDLLEGDNGVVQVDIEMIPHRRLIQKGGGSFRRKQVTYMMIK